MIQRRQTLWLLAAVIIGMVHMLAWPLFIIQMLASALSLYAIFRYKQRKTQAALCLAGVVVNLMWYIALAVMTHKGLLSEQYPYTIALPLVAAILCFLARRDIIADERLVRASDRIR